MNRPAVLLVSRSSVVCNAMTAVTGLFVPSAGVPHRVESFAMDCPESLFDRLDSVPPNDLRDLAVIVDLTLERTPWANGVSPPGLATSLILSYPEIFFTFLDVNSKLANGIQSDGEVRAPMIVDSVVGAMVNLARHARGFRTLFDPRGERSKLKDTLAIELKRLGRNSRYDFEISSRSKRLVAVADDEWDLAYLNGFAFYKRGFRAELLVSEREFVETLVDATEGKYEFLISDLDLAYVDSAAPAEGAGDSTPSPNKGLVAAAHTKVAIGNGLPRNESSVTLPSATAARETQATKLSKHSTTFEILWKRAKDIRKERQKGEPKVGFKAVVVVSTVIDNIKIDNIDKLIDAKVTPIAKPYGGFTQLVNDAQALPPKAAKPDPFPTTQTVDPLRGHSAPFAMTIVARRLLARAHALSGAEDYSTAAAVQTSVLALEAKELLGGLSRTLSLEALALQHDAQLKAEMSSFAIAIGPDHAKERLKDLRKEADSIFEVLPADAQYDDAVTYLGRELAKLTFLAQTISNLRHTYAANEHVAAADDCLVEYASIQNRIKASAAALSISKRLTKARKGSSTKRSEWTKWGRGRARGLVSFLELVQLHWYFDLATRAGTSLLYLFFATFLWVAAFGGANWLYLSRQMTETNPSAQDTAESNRSVAAWHSVLTFLEIQPGLSGEIEAKLSPSQVAPTAAARSPQPPCESPPVKKVFLGFRRLVLLELIVAVTHLGLLVSMLYRRLLRQAT